MDPGSLTAISITVVASLVVLCASGLTVLASVALPLALLWVVIKRVASGNAVVVVSGPLVHALAPAEPPGPRLVKRTRCPACGAPKVHWSMSAYVYCDFCGQLADWDFQACLADKRSRLPGPTYEALERRVQPKLDAARAAHALEDYQALQREIFGAYVEACPAACPPRVGDAHYKARFVAWSAESQALQDLSPRTAATFAAQQAAVQALQWDRSNPFQPKVRAQSFDGLLEAVLAHQRACTELLVQTGLLERHPDRPEAAVFERIGRSALVQGWLPYLTHRDAVIARADLVDEYESIEPPELEDGPCPNCGRALRVAKGAKRVLCHGCGHMLGVGRGKVGCHGCGSEVELPGSGDRFACQHCDAELLLMRRG